MEIKSYRDLRVWQAAMDLVEVIYRFTLGFPRAELFNMTTGMRRVSVEIPTKIAEGHTSEQLRDYLGGIDAAQKKLANLQTQIDLSGRLGYVSPEVVQKTTEQAESLARQLYALRNALLRNG
jgi:four helix bundle protein